MIAQLPRNRARSAFVRADGSSETCDTPTCLATGAATRVV
jgi:hypothetical protein